MWNVIGVAVLAMDKGGHNVSNNYIGVLGDYWFAH